MDCRVQGLEPSLFESSITVVPNEETSFNSTSQNVSFHASTFNEKAPIGTSSNDLGSISFICSVDEFKLNVGTFALIIKKKNINKDFIQMT